MKKIIQFVIFLVAFLQAETFTFYLFVPEYKEWIEAPPAIKNLENGDSVSMSADEYVGWYYYSWNKNEVPDSVLIYSRRDSSYLDPISLDGYCSKTVSPLRMKLLSDAINQNAIFFVADSSSREIVNSEDGFSYFDIRKELHYAQKDSFDYYVKTLFVLVPDYKEWINEIPVAIDAYDFSRAWEMLPDDRYDGWFFHSWKYCSETPDSIYLVKKMDNERKSLVGINGYAYGETELVALNLEMGREIYFYPDLNYDCEIPGKDCFCEKEGECFCNIQERSTWQYYDVRSECQLRYDCLKDDFEPTYYDNVNKLAFMYTVSSVEGTLIQAEKKMTSDANDVVYFDKQSIHVNTKQLVDGSYIVEFWPIANGSARKRILRFSVKNGVASKGPSFVKRPYIGIQTFGSSIQISSSISQPYVIFSSMGQTITRGSVKGTINVKMPSAGIYLVKVGAEMLRIKVFE